MNSTVHMGHMGFFSPSLQTLDTPVTEDKAGSSPFHVTSHVLQENCWSNKNMSKMWKHTFVTQAD